MLWVGPTARGSSFQAVTKRADRERETRLREPSMGKDDQHRIGKAEGGVTLEVMRPRPMAGNAQARNCCRGLWCHCKASGAWLHAHTPRLDDILDRLSGHPIGPPLHIAGALAAAEAHGGESSLPTADPPTARWQTRFSTRSKSCNSAARKSDIAVRGDPSYTIYGLSPFGNPSSRFTPSVP